MFEKTEIRRSKVKVSVEILLTNGERLDGDMFITRGARVSDALNDERAFLPLEMGETELRMIAKTSIASVRFIDETRSAGSITDPFELLRVPPTAPLEEIRRAWMQRLKTCHPDRLAALNLDEEIVASARRACQRINAAYDDIMRSRRQDERAAS